MANRDRYDEMAENLAFEARAWKTEKGAAERIAAALRAAAEEARREERDRWQCPFHSRAQGYRCEQPRGHGGEWCSNGGDGFAPGWDPSKGPAIRARGGSGG